MSLPLVVGLGSVDPALVTGGLDPGVHCVAEPDARQPATTAGPSPALRPSSTGICWIACPPFG